MFLRNIESIHLSVGFIKIRTLTLILSTAVTHYRQILSTKKGSYLSTSTFNENIDRSTKCWLLWLTRPESLILATHGIDLVELIKRIGELSGSKQIFTGTDRLMSSANRKRFKIPWLSQSVDTICYTGSCFSMRTGKDAVTRLAHDEQCHKYQLYVHRTVLYLCPIMCTCTWYRTLPT